MRKHLTYANVASSLALVVALSGGAYAVASVTGKDIVNGSVTGKDIKKGSVSVNRLKGTVAGPAGPPGAPATTLWAVVDNDASLVRGSGVVSTSSTGTGGYEVIFNRAVNTCSFQATASQLPGEVLVQPRIGVPAGVFVGTYSSAGALTDRGFHLAVFC